MTWRRLGPRPHPPCAVQVLLALALAAGCAPSVTSSGAEPTLPVYRREAAYMTAVRAELDTDAPDGALLTTARDICAYLAAGRTRPELVGYAQQRHALTTEDAEFVVATAVRTHCPGHVDDRA